MVCWTRVLPCWMAVGCGVACQMRVTLLVACVELLDVCVILLDGGWFVGYV